MNEGGLIWTDWKISWCNLYFKQMLVPYNNYKPIYKDNIVVRQFKRHTHEKKNVHGDVLT